MNFQLILDNIAKHITLTKEEETYFISLLQAKTYKRKQIVLKEGEICKHSTFVVSGCLRGFTVDKNGFEHILNFAPPNWWIGDIYSLITQKAGRLTIESIYDSEVFIMSKENQEALYTNVPKFERFFRIIVENSLVSYQQRVIDNMSLTAEERYIKFCRVYPTLINELPQKLIAAYIGITPEFLSKMRSQMLRKK
jgi:CRP-like cAMP-binding protein